MDLDSLWRTVIGELEVTASVPDFNTWYKPTVLLGLSGDDVEIGVPNIFIKNNLEKKYGSALAEMLAKNGIPDARITYKVMSGSAKKRLDDEPVMIVQSVNRTAAAPTTDLPIVNPATHSYRQGLNNKYNFDSFIVGSSSELAFAACQAVTEHPGTKYNPLFLYGGVGIGKTHLMQAVGNKISTDKPGTNVIYISTEQFVQEFVDALRYRKASDFSQFYRSADVFIVDDIQFIAGKEKIQEEFFHTFNALHQANKQIIISSDRPPREIPTLEERLSSRFASGITIDMQTPDFETRCAIIKSKASLHNTVIPVDAIEYLANNGSTNIRELEGVLNQLFAHCEVRNIDPSMTVVTSLVSNVKTRPKHVSAKQIIERTAKYFQIPVEDMLGPKRDKEIVVPRQVAMYILREEFGLSFPKIARELGRKDHTTAIHSVAKIAEDQRTDTSLRMAISEIRERLYA